MSTDAGHCDATRLVHITTVPMSLRFLRGQVGYMRARGFEIHAISSPGDELSAFGRDEHVQTHPVEMPRRITPLHDIGAVWKLVRELRRIRSAIVHAHTPKGGLLGMIAAWLARSPVRVYHMRGLPHMTATGRRRALLKAAERVSCRLAHRVICVSHSIRDVAIRDGVCPADKITVLAGGSGNGVDADGAFNPDRFGPDDRSAIRPQLGIPVDALVIGFVGRIVRDKGIHELGAAWQQLRAEFPQTHLVLVGPIEPRDPIDSNMLRLFREDSRVHLTGMVADPSALYAVFDVVVLPTWREGFPNVPLEAAAMRLPVVATRIPGCIDAVADGVTGTLVPPGDAKAHREAMARYLEDSELRARHGAAGRERVLREFRQEVIWDALHHEYVQLARERGIDLPDTG